MTGNPISTAATAGDPRGCVYDAQWWLLYSVMVAGKQAEQTTEKLNTLLAVCDVQAYANRKEDVARSFFNVPELPFNIVKKVSEENCLKDCLAIVKTGQYGRIAAAFKDMTTQCTKPNVGGEDPREWSLELIETIPGVGPKTARFYWLMIHPDARVAALDTHVLKFLRDVRPDLDPPRATPPPGPRYRELELAFVEQCERLNMAPRDLDYFIWALYRNGGRITFEKGENQ